MNHDAIALAQLRGICAAFIDNRMSPLAFEQSVACAAEADAKRRAAAPGTIWLAAIDTENGGTTLHAAASEARIIAAVASFCRDHWEERGWDDPVPVTDRAIVAAYFADCEDWHVIQEATVLLDGATPCASAAG